MEDKSIDMKVGTFNQNYERATNCRAVKAPYDLDGTFSEDFFLDRRLGLESAYGTDHDEEVNVEDFLDAIDCNGRRYYLYKKDGRAYVGTFTDPVAKTGFVNVSGVGFPASECSRMVKGRGATGVQYNLNAGSPTPWTVVGPTVGAAGSKDFESIPGYAGGYVKFKHAGSLPITTGQYLVFRSGILSGTTILVDLVEGVDAATQDIYVIGTNSRGSLPYSIGANDGNGALFDVFGAYGETILVGHAPDPSTSVSVTMLVLDDENPARHVPILKTVKPIIDMAKFNANLYALTEDSVYYSDSVLHSDASFYPLDRLPINGGKSLFPIGKAMIAFADTNLVIAPLVSQSGEQKIVGYALRYDGKPYSKHSCLISSKTIMVLQKDKKLVELDLVQNDSVSFDVNSKDVAESNRGLFESLPDDGEVYGSDINGSINFILSGDQSKVYRYDKLVKSWFIDDYSRKINRKFSDPTGVGVEILGRDHIFEEGGDDDEGVGYSQEVSFSMLGWPAPYMIYWLRTMFGLPDNPIDLQFKFDYELAGEKHSDARTLTGFQFDTRFNEDETGDELPGLGLVPKEATQYDGTFVSLQTSIMKSGRHLRFTYSSDKRFVIGHSRVFHARFKPFVNEPIGNS